MSKESNEDRRKELRSKLIDAFSECAGPQRMLTRSEVEELGIPSRHASGIVRESHRIASDTEAVNAAAEWSDYIADRLESEEAMTPEEIAKRVGRL